MNPTVVRRKVKHNAPFLKPDEINLLAAKLHIRPFAVYAVLQVAGHVLRERYRRRGWLTRPRDEGRPQPAGVERRIVAEAINEVACESPTD